MLTQQLIKAAINYVREEDIIKETYAKAKDKVTNVSYTITSLV
jgi:hypothetical protein